MANWTMKQEGSPTTPDSGKNNLYFDTSGVLKSLNSSAATTTYATGSGTAYVVGGTDVAVADGGTGASTAAGARSNLGVPTITIVRKTADETVNNSTTLQDDDHLLFSVAANEIWHFEAHLRATSPTATPDLKVAWSLPSGGTFEILHNNGIGLGTGGNSGLGTSNIGLGLNSSTNYALCAGWLYIGATAGTANLQWAQNTLTAEDTKVLTNSFLKLTKLA